MKRFVLGAALAAAFAVPAHSGILYNFVQTSEGGSYAPFSGVTMQLALNDGSAGMSSVNFKQVGNGGNPAATTGSGVDQFGFYAIGGEQYGSSNRLPMSSFNSTFEAGLFSLLNGGLGGALKFYGEHDTMTAAYDPNSGEWHGQFAADYMMPCGQSGSCTFSGYFVQVSEPVTLALFGAGLLALVGWRRKNA